MKNMNTIPRVRAELLFEAAQKIANDHEAGLEPDPTVSTVAVLHDKCEPEEMTAITLRLTALAKLVREGEGDGWLLEVDGRKHVLVKDALMKAAARAKLHEADTVGQVRFDPQDILNCALAETEVDGSA
ncbi:hypothetical protein [Parasphingopyxis sp.]|uniref:hypothetical protein n=1 Tax=Parasphingopyxis sp. TaxID=1920299 RepID=UPI002619779E|nr:hypothetical protein [Parasphingopyxis sp.]